MEHLLLATEKFFDSLGMMTGEYAIPKRFLFGVIAGGSILFLAQPSFMFTEDGSMKPWNLITKGTEEEKKSTWIPFWMGALAIGVLPATFI